MKKDNEPMLNHITYEAAEHSLGFYSNLLKSELKELAIFKAHYNIALLLWRNKRQAGIEEIVNHFQLAAESALRILSEEKSEKKKNSDDVMSFMDYAFVISIYGSKEQRIRFSKIERDKWAPSDNPDFQSLIEVLGYLCSSSEDRTVSKSIISKIKKANQNPSTHPFYKPWINEFISALTAIEQSNNGNLIRACNELLELHEDEAHYAGWKQNVDGLMAFWVLAIKDICMESGVNFPIESPYIPILKN